MKQIEQNFEDQKAASEDAALMNIHTTGSRRGLDQGGLLANFTWVVAND